MARSLSTAGKQRFQARTNTLFSKAYELQKLFAIKVAVIVQLDGVYHVYRSSRSEAWPPSMKDIVDHNEPLVKLPEHFQTIRELRDLGDLTGVEGTEILAGEGGSNMPPLQVSNKDSVEEHTPGSSIAVSTLMQMTGQSLPTTCAGIVEPIVFDGFNPMAPLPSQEASMPPWQLVSTIQTNGDLAQAAEQFGYDVPTSRRLESAVPQTRSYSPRPSGITKRSAQLRSVSRSPHREQAGQVRRVPAPPRLNSRVDRRGSMRAGRQGAKVLDNAR